MHINDAHMFHGAALTQIAEHPAFTAINAFGEHGDESRCAFRINANIGILIKYSSAPNRSFKEYVFTFTKAHLDELDNLATQCPKMFVVLVCIKAKEICVLSLQELKNHIQARTATFGGPEPQYQVLVTAAPRKGFRVYMNRPGRKKISLQQQIVSRRRFPDAIFV
jgi:hypothetical protein